jgi:cysteinyl-tRNA synthetase
MVGVADAAADDGELGRFRAFMDDDLDTPSVVAQLFGLATAANTALDGGDPATAATAWATIGEITRAVGIQIRAAGGEVPHEVAALARERDEARGAKDFGRADELRDAIRALGFEVEDTPEGTRVHRA